MLQTLFTHLAREASSSQPTPKPNHQPPTFNQEALLLCLTPSPSPSRAFCSSCCGARGCWPHLEGSVLPEQLRAQHIAASQQPWAAPQRDSGFYPLAVRWPAPRVLPARVTFSKEVAKGQIVHFSAFCVRYKGGQHGSCSLAMGFIISNNNNEL